MDVQLVWRVRSGQLPEPARGVYTAPARPCTWLQRVEVARLDASLDALACQPTAAVLNRFDDFRQGRPHILVPFGTTNHSRLAVIHQTRHLGAIDRCYPQGIPSTTPERTVIDLAMMLSFERLDRLVESELIHGRIDGERLAERFLSLTRRGLRGSKKLRAILAKRLADGEEVPASVLEALLLRRLRENGLPEPVRSSTFPGGPPRAAGSTTDFCPIASYSRPTAAH